MAEHGTELGCLGAIVEIKDRGGVEQAIVIPGHGYERANGIADTRAENDAIAACRDRMPERFPGAVGIVEPPRIGQIPVTIELFDRL